MYCLNAPIINGLSMPKIGEKINLDRPDLGIIRHTAPQAKRLYRTPDPWLLILERGHVVALSGHS